ncbi:MAG: stage III sporulation protein AE [Oscillospiraceae bacterium]|nr:stage III sporulation protein AE [Oscillospiraceae bacterium]
MKRLIALIGLVFILAMPVSALEVESPQAPSDAQDLLPGEVTSFGEDLWELFKRAVKKAEPQISQAAGLCLSLTAISMLAGILHSTPGKPVAAVELAGVIAAALLLLNQTQSLITCASQTVVELSEYGKLLLPVMTTALAAQGGITGSTALYMGTAVFDSVLSSLISKLLIPLVYIFLALAVASKGTGQEMLKKLQGFVKWLVSWGLKIIMYIFTGYISITGVVAGASDEAAVKATKLTMSGMIPMVGGILSDASEAVVVGAGMAKNAVGVYGMLAILAIWISPFIRIGISYLILKLTAVICQCFGVKQIAGVVENFSEAMGMLLAMTGACCMLLLISMICFMKGMG